MGTHYDLRQIMRFVFGIWARISYPIPLHETNAHQNELLSEIAESYLIKLSIESNRWVISFIHTNHNGDFVFTLIIDFQYIFY